MFTRFLAGPLLVVTVVLATSSPALAQFNRGGGGGGRDPKAWFDRMANGEDFIVISKANPYVRGDMQKYATDNKITNDKLTFEQFKAFSEQRSKEGGGYKKNGGGGPRSKDASKEKATDAKPTAAPSRPALAEKAHSSPSITTRVVSDDELERRPVVYRAGKLPPGLPDWFAKLDKDKDGQIDLGEWRLAGKEIAEFKKMDLNNDGLLTPDEVLRYLDKADKAEASEESTSAETPSATSAKSESKDSGDDAEKTDKSSNKVAARGVDD